MKNTNVKKIISGLIFAIAIVYSIVSYLNGGSFSDNTLYNGEQSQSVISENYYDNNTDVEYTFRKAEHLTQHYEKHGGEFGYKTEQEYLIGANRVINSAEVLRKSEKEDGDNVYYLEKTNELVIVSTDGYIRTYFKPDDGIDYFKRQ